MIDDDDEKQAAYEAFRDLVDLTPTELEARLEEPASKRVGHEKDTPKASTGHRSGRRIVGLERTKRADLSDDDDAHMRKVVNYIKRTPGRGARDAVALLAHELGARPAEVSPTRLRRPR